MIVRMNLLLNRTVVLPVTDASTTCAVVIFSVKVSCITSVLYYGHWCDWSIKVLSTRIRFHLKTQLFLYGHSFRAHVSDENDQWKRHFSKTLSRVELFENAVFVCTCHGGQTKTALFENAEDTQFQSTLRNIRADLFKMADGSFPFLCFTLGLISNIIACFQANLALLILQADYSRGRQNIIRLLSLPVSRGGKSNLRLVTSAEREVKDSRHSGMYQSCNFGYLTKWEPN